jgi:magnesium and cobalt transporter
MNEESQSTNGLATVSWLDKLKHAFTTEPRDREHLVELLRDAQRRNLLDVDALAMIEGVLQVAEMQVRDIMIPRSQMVVIERDMEIDKMLKHIVKSGHSRFPVIGDSRDEVVGILLAKDMLRIVVENEKSYDTISDSLRPAVFVPESKRLNVLLKEFRASRNHMAVVVDEYGGVAGIVTIEDVIEQIVGEIEDEHDVDDSLSIREHEDSKFTVKALTPIEEFNDYFETDFNDGEFDTIGGLLIKKFGHLPKRNETMTMGDLVFKILRADNRRIHLIQVTVETDSQP